MDADGRGQSTTGRVVVSLAASGFVAVAFSLLVVWLLGKFDPHAWWVSPIGVGAGIFLGTMTYNRLMDARG